MKTRPHPALPLLLLVLAATGCEEKQVALDLGALTPGEQVYFDRVVTLERARSIAMVDPGRGHVLLDSLAAAWGDSAVADVLDGLSTEPARAEAVHQLLARVVGAEHDSLLWAPGVSRLGLPLPDPDRPGRAREADPSGAKPRLDDPTGE